MPSWDIIHKIFGHTGDEWLKDGYIVHIKIADHHHERIDL